MLITWFFIFIVNFTLTFWSRIVLMIHLISKNNKIKVNLFLLFCMIDMYNTFVLIFLRTKVGANT